MLWQGNVTRGNKEQGTEGSAPRGRQARVSHQPDDAGRSVEEMNLFRWCLSNGVDRGAGGRLAQERAGSSIDNTHLGISFFQVLKQDVLNRFLDKTPLNTKANCCGYSRGHSGEHGFYRVFQYPEGCLILKRLSI